MDLQRNKIHLYATRSSSRTTSVIVPDFLTLLRRDRLPGHSAQRLPLYLGGREREENHRPHLKKVSDKLAKMFKDDRADFESKWQDIQVFTEYGMLMDEKFFERAGKFALYKDTEGTCRTMGSSKRSRDPHRQGRQRGHALHARPRGPAAMCPPPVRLAHGAPPRAR